MVYLPLVPLGGMLLFQPLTGYPVRWSILGLLMWYPAPVIKNKKSFLFIIVKRQRKHLYLLHSFSEIVFFNKTIHDPVFVWVAVRTHTTKVIRSAIFKQTGRQIIIVNMSIFDLSYQLVISEGAHKFDISSSCYSLLQIAKTNRIVIADNATITKSEKYLNRQN